jgi:hypothetical protein
MSWLNPWYWWQTPEDDEGQDPVEPQPKQDYKVLEGVEIDKSRVWLCDELLALKKQSLNPVEQAPPPTPETKKIEQKLKFHKKKLRKKRNYKRRRYEKLDFAVN